MLFWVGGLICALIKILMEKDKDDAGKDYGDAGVSWRGNSLVGIYEPLWNMRVQGLLSLLGLEMCL